MANGTNRIAILLQALVASGKFKQDGLVDTQEILRFGIPTLLGSLLGAQIAVTLNEEILRQTIGYLMVFMFFIIASRPRRWLTGEKQKLKKNSLFKTVIFFIVGIYGGFIQAGVGIFILTGLVLGVGYDLVRGNAIKVGIVSLQALAALIMFIMNGQVLWAPGLVLAIGTTLGAWLGAKAASERGADYIHRILLLVIAVAALKILNIGEVLRSICE